MKKITLFLALILLLAACGGEKSESNNETNNENLNTEEQAETTEVSGEEEKNTEHDETAGGNKVGDVISNEAGDSTLVSLANDVGTFESGPIKLTIDKANGVSMEVSNSYVDLFETNQLEYIQVDMTVENTSEDHITFYASQAVMTTSTGEQLDPDFILSDHIDGEYLGPITKSGSSFYILENSKAEDVESIKLFYSAPSNEDWEDVGEEIVVEIPLSK